MCVKKIYDAFASQVQVETWKLFNIFVSGGSFVEDEFRLKYNNDIENILYKNLYLIKRFLYLMDLTTSEADIFLFISVVCEYSNKMLNKYCKKFLKTTSNSNNYKPIVFPLPIINSHELPTNCLMFVF